MGIQYNDLFNKAKIYIEKAFEQRDKGEFGEFQLWASITLELLGKATLASIHPSLVVDPNDPNGLLVACGHKEADENVKTITAKTVFERLHKTLKVPRFDQKTKDFCMKLANRRNAELHSGSIPFEGIAVEGWIPKYWDVCKILLDFQKKSLEDFIGEQEALSAEEIITDHSQTLQKIIELRIRKHVQIYKQKYSNHDPQQIVFNTEMDEEIVECPACGNYGVAEGELYDRDFAGRDEDEPWIVYFNEYYDVTSFKCLYCDLKLIGLDEIKFSGMTDEFMKTVEDEPDYEPDYGND